MEQPALPLAELWSTIELNPRGGQGSSTGRGDYKVNNKGVTK